MSTKHYPPDLNDAEWRRLRPYVPAPKPGGRPAQYERRAILVVPFSSCHSRRAILNAILVVPFSMPSSIWCAAAALGGCCPATYRPGSWSTTTFASGRERVGGNRFMRSCALRCATKRVRSPSPAPECWIRNGVLDSQRSAGFATECWIRNGVLDSQTVSCAAPAGERGSCR
jgi:transposase